MIAINSIILYFVHALGHFLHACPSCNNFTFVWHTCKSRFCNSCGMNYAKIRSHNILQKVFDRSHRHCVFTIPKELCNHLRKDCSLLDILFLSVNQTLSFIIRKAGNKQDSLIPYAVLALHTFGRPLNWNLHIHVLLRLFLESFEYGFSNTLCHNMQVPKKQKKPLFKALFTSWGG